MENGFYSLTEIDSEFKLENLRIIRNECREYMTRYNDEISKQQQRQWFDSLDKTKIFPYLFLENYYGACLTFIGYGMIQLENGVSSLSAGLSKNNQGMGLGKILFENLIEKSKEMNCASIELEVLKTNIRAYKLYEKLGFKVANENDNIYHMKLT